MGLSLSISRWVLHRIFKLIFFFKCRLVKQPKAFWGLSQNVFKCFYPVCEIVPFTSHFSQHLSCRGSSAISECGNEPNGRGGEQGSKETNNLQSFRICAVGNMQKCPELLHILHSALTLEMCLGRTPGFEVPRGTWKEAPSPPGCFPS